MSELKPCPFCGGEAGGSHKRETKSRLLAALSNKGENLSGDVKVSVRGGRSEHSISKRSQGEEDQEGSAVLRLLRGDSSRLTGPCPELV